MTPRRDTTTLDLVLARAADPEGFERWALQGRAARWCCHPVRLAGTTSTVDPGSGEVLGRYSTATEPDGTLIKACGQRRATACPQCAEVYRGDAWHLIAAGLRGGKGVPRSVTANPMVFLTLTAPSFGPVHSRRERAGLARPCRNGTTKPCPHGRLKSCPVVHQPDDDLLGQPLCFDCFDYRRAIVWNALAGELWRRTTIGITRALAAEAGVTVSAFSDLAHLSFIKVVEYQRRGVVHFHAVVRLDGPTGPASMPPLQPAPFERAILLAARAARVPYPPGTALIGAATWGREIDLRAVATAGARADVVAAYIAKYVTKSSDPLGRLDHKLKDGDLTALDLPPHLARLVATAWDLGDRPEFAHLRLRDWAHTLGFRGHWLTKSRHYSTTFGALRGARTTWNRRRAATVSGHPDSITVKDWRYLGRGWANAGDAWLAETAADELAQSRRLARQARCADQRQSDWGG